MTPEELQKKFNERMKKRNNRGDNPLKQYCISKNDHKSKRHYYDKIIFKGCYKFSRAGKMNGAL